MGITITRLVRKRTRLDGVAINDENITFQEELRRELFQVVDQLRNEINKRFEQMDTINKRFGFLQLEIIMDIGTNLSNKASMLSLMFIMRSMVMN